MPVRSLSISRALISRSSIGWLIGGILTAVVPTAALHAQSDYATPYTFTTLAGTVSIPVLFGGSADGTGSAAQFENPAGVAVDPLGNVYVADLANNTIRKVTPAGVVTTIAGTPAYAGYADGTGSAAQFHNPFGVAVDSTGNIYVADTGNSAIRKITSSGVVTHLAGSNTFGVGSADGVGSAALFDTPEGIAVDNAGTIYVADTYNSTIRKVTPAGVVTTFAGTAGVMGIVDGTGSAAQFYRPTGIAIDSAGNIYVTDLDTIREITPAGVVTTIAGTPGISLYADGTGSAALFNYPWGVAVDSTGNVYVADNGDNTIRKITSGGVVTTIAGTAGTTGSADGTGSAALFRFPQGIAVDNAGNLYVADGGNDTIREGTLAAGPPGAPIGVSVVPGNDQATVIFTAPIDTGYTITGYTVTATPSSGSPITATGSSSPITVTGLSNGVAYTFTVTATNSAGTGPASSPTPAITPELPPIYWSIQSPSGLTDAIWGVTYANGTFAAVTSLGKVLTSADGLAWSSQTAAQGTLLESIAYGNGTWVIVGDMGTILVSTDLKTWVSANIATTNRLNSVLYNGSTWMAVGEADTIIISTDAINWTVVPIPPSQGNSGGNAFGISGFLRGITWDEYTENGPEFLVSGSASGNNSPPYGNYSGGTVLNVSFLNVEPGSTGPGVTTFNWYYGLGTLPEPGAPVEAILSEPDSPGLDMFVGVGDAGVMVAFPNPTSPPNTPSITYRGLTYGNGYWVVAGGDDLTGGDATILTSEDGVNWTRDYSATVAMLDSAELLSAAYSPTLQRFVVTGTGGTILVSNAAAAAGAVPIIPTQPVGGTIAFGANTTLSIVASGTPTPTYQWQVDGVNISGATSSSYVTSMPGTYTVVVTNSHGSVTSSPAVLTAATRLANISCRALVGTNANIEIAGFVITAPPGTTEQVLVRAAGPALAQFGVSGFLAQPVLTLFSASGSQVAANTGWSTAPNASDIAAAFATTGAFAFLSGSADSALLVSLPPGAYTAQISGLNGTAGVALAEVYEVRSGDAELINISTRAFVGGGANVEIGGFVVTGSQPAKVLIRGIGPALTQFGVTGVLMNPSLTVADSSGNTVASNTGGWATNTNAAAINSEMAAVGAFNLPPTSADSALLLTLPPGAYTAVVSGTNGTTGVALVEVYQAP